MLSYAFWHWKQSGIPGPEYESRQRDFQAALAAHPPEGFLYATTARLGGAPWANQGAAAYEDWYLLRDMAALAPLNEAAVSGPRQAPHNAVARLAAGGTAGLYGLQGGAPVETSRAAAWFGKPSGMSYASLFALLEPVVSGSGGALWMRQMVLGPTPEFCLQSVRPAELPSPIAALSLSLSPVWPAA